MSSSTFKPPLTVTHITTAAAILNISGIDFLTDPVFSPAGTEWKRRVGILKNTEDPVVQLQNLPVIDAILLSHEDHPDNLDELRRRLLDGRTVLTTADGVRNLAPRPGVQALQPWESVVLTIGGREFQVTGTPCQHLPGGEVTGFFLSAVEFGSKNGLPNAIYISGDTIYLEELAQMREKFYISAAILNVGATKIAVTDPPLQITMDGKQASRLFHEPIQRMQ
ncbi:uncharacterized protein ColSpa_04511 [Colletotrichum spaethianum]|uniref:Metallo-beta-lactamase domain-containing protein n=1 Tax=Colletotrichum spaethianum TaxID=700344 RepID=A0AA37NZD4_9PEZI|nr:uncharacterized protein ColSpa_04511 [Colletotrichum spaethianum]GKT44330.1 hypothetical protein ColSpa_04511 [Colletotrichum spaethianum]